MPEQAQQKFWQQLQFTDQKYHRQTMNLLSDAGTLKQTGIAQAFMQLPYIRNYFEKPEDSSTIKKILSNENILHNMPATPEGRQLFINMVNRAQKDGFYLDKDSIDLLPGLVSYMENGGKADTTVDSLINRFINGEVSLIQPESNKETELGGPVYHSHYNRWPLF